MLRNNENQYFNDPKIYPRDKTLLVFASYNAGPSRIAELREQAREQGLDPNKWFDNVQLMLAKSVGQETVTYVSNVYKYYVAYKLAMEQSEETVTCDRRFKSFSSGKRDQPKTWYRAGLNSRPARSFWATSRGQKKKYATVERPDT